MVYLLFMGFIFIGAGQIFELMEHLISLFSRVTVRVQAPRATSKSADLDYQNTLRDSGDIVM